MTQQLRDLCELRTLERDEARDIRDMAHADVRHVTNMMRAAQDLACSIRRERDAANAQSTKFAETLERERALADIAHAEARTLVVELRAELARLKSGIDARELDEQSRRERKARPAIGTTVTGAQAWAHMMACPEARYAAQLGYGERHEVRGARKPSGFEALLHAWTDMLFSATNGHWTGWTFTRLQDVPETKAGE